MSPSFPFPRDLHRSPESSGPALLSACSLLAYICQDNGQPLASGKHSLILRAVDIQFLITGAQRLGPCVFVHAEQGPGMKELPCFNEAKKPLFYLKVHIHLCSVLRKTQLFAPCNVLNTGLCWGHISWYLVLPVFWPVCGLLKKSWCLSHLPVSGPTLLPGTQ